MAKLTVAYQTGKSLNFIMFNHATGTSGGTGAMVEEHEFYYTVNVPAVAAGTWDIVYIDNSIGPIGAEQIIWDGTAVIGSEDATLASIKSKTDNLPASPAAVGDIPTSATITAAVAAKIITDHGTGNYAATTDTAAIITELDSIKARTDLIGTDAALSVQREGSFDTNGNITLVQGDDYLAADDSALQFHFTGVVPDLTGGTVKLKADWTYDDSTAFNITGTVTSPTSNPSISFDVPSATTSALRVGDPAYEYSVKATLADGSLKTLQIGTLTVKDD
jgi:hypothetical protein